MEMEEPDCSRYNFRTKTPISSELIAQIDGLYDGGLTKWKTRYWPLVIRQRKNIDFFHIAVTQLYESARLGCPDALDILDEVIACTSAMSAIKSYARHVAILCRSVPRIKRLQRFPIIRKKTSSS
jgi:hypothetical protein